MTILAAIGQVEATARTFPTRDPVVERLNARRERGDGGDLKHEGQVEPHEILLEATGQWWLAGIGRAKTLENQHGCEEHPQPGGPVDIERHPVVSLDIDGYDVAKRRVSSARTAAADVLA